VQFSSRTLVCRVGVVVALAVSSLVVPAPVGAGARSSSIAGSNSTAALRAGIVARKRHPRASIAQLRSAFDLLYTAMHMESHLPASSVCSQATARGRWALIEIIRGQMGYLPSETCESALVDRGKSFELCTGEGNYVPYVERALRTARLQIKGRHATVQLGEDIACTDGGAAGGSQGEQLDKMGLTHWVERRGRWLFDDEPTGTYTPAGRKADALLRAALSGSKITESYEQWPGHVVTDGADFCANGTTHTILISILIPEATPWYVQAGYSVFTHTLVPPFDTQGNPVGAVYVVSPVSIEYGVQLVDGKIIPTPPTGTPSLGPLTYEPGTAGC
jgi:hypothetical protein